MKRSKIRFAVFGVVCASALGVFAPTVAVAEEPPYVPSEAIKLQAPWTAGDEWYPQTYADHTDTGHWGAVDFYTTPDRDDSDGGLPVRAAHGGVALYQPSTCGGNRRILVTDETLGIRTYYSHVRFPASIEGSDRRPVSAGQLIGYTRDWGEFDDCQNWPHLMFRVQLKLGPDSSDWQDVDIREIALDDQRLMEELTLSGPPRWHGTPITSYAAEVRRPGDRVVAPAHTDGKTTVSSLGSVRATSARRMVSAFRGADGNLKIRVFDVATGGSITLKGSASAGAASSIALLTSGPGEFATSSAYALAITAVRTGSGSLKVIVWKVKADGSVERKGSATASGAVEDVSAAKLLAYSPTTRIATAARTAAGNLSLAVWDVAFVAGTVSRVASLETGWSVGDVAVTAKSGFVVAATRKFSTATGEFHMTVATWRPETTCSGRICSLAIVQRDAVSVLPALSDLSFARLSSSNVVAAGISTAGHLTLRTFGVASDGSLDYRDSASMSEILAVGARGQEVSEVALATSGARVLAAARLTEPVDSAFDADGGHLKLAAWTVSSDGDISRGRAAIAGTGDPLNVSAASVGTSSRFATALRDGSGNLKVIVWDTV